jgi:hypothetical protein
MIFNIKTALLITAAILVSVTSAGKPLDGPPGQDVGGPPGEGLVNGVPPGIGLANPPGLKGAAPPGLAPVGEICGGYSPCVKEGTLYFCVDGQEPGDLCVSPCYCYIE